MKYFYILMRNGGILEIPYSEKSYHMAFEEMLKKGLLAIVPKGATKPSLINTVDVSQVLDEEAYNSFVESVRPREYIQDGIWRDGKERKVVRYERWKQQEMDSVKKIEAKEVSKLTPEEIVHRNETIAKMRAELVKKGVIRTRKLSPTRALT